MGVTVTATGSSLVGSELTRDAGASVRAVSAIAQRLSDLAVEAAELDERAAAVAERERSLDALAAILADEHARQIVRAAELDDREVALADHRAALEEQESLVASREAVVARLQQDVREQAHTLEEQALRFHWRWFLRIWAWRPRLSGANARVCELFHVPSPSGYKLLEQTGVSVTPRARISGLLDEDVTYAVMKIAQLPLDGRWCAYLEIDEFRGGEQ